MVAISFEIMCFISELCNLMISFPHLDLQKKKKKLKWKSILFFLSQCFPAMPQWFLKCCTAFTVSVLLLSLHVQLKIKFHSILYSILIHITFYFGSFCLFYLFLKKNILIVIVGFGTNDIHVYSIQFLLTKWQ